jgi:hypothetical protein
MPRNLVMAMLALACAQGAVGKVSKAPPREVVLAAPTAPPQIDGVFGDAEWSGALTLELGFQTQPGDNVPPSERTEVRLAYDREHLYVAFRAFDRDPAAIRARMARRDDVSADDYVGLYLDTFDDRRRAYVFHFNPRGIQSDGIYREGSSLDLSWDGLLRSQGTLLPDGFLVEAAIPFATLRTKAAQRHRWGLHVERWIARRAEKVHWQPISRDISSLLIQMGALQGLEGIRGGSLVEFIPAVTASSTGTRLASGQLHTVHKLDPGLTFNWSVTPSLTLSGAVNPDFSQIEADVPQIEVNQRFPLFFPEKRPFFLEGNDVFRSIGALTFLDTRQIVDPDWGVKLTGKTGRNSVGLLAAADRAPGLRFSPGHPAFREKARFAVARYQRDILRDSTVGVFVTDYRFAGSSNTVAAADGQLLFRRVHTIGFQLAHSRSRDLNGRAAGGAATYAWYQHQGRHLRLFVNDQRSAADYHTQAGFLRRTGFHANSTNSGWEFQPRQRTWWVRVRPFLATRTLRTTESLLDESYVDPGVDLLLARNVRLYIYHSFRTESFSGREFPHQFDVVDYTVNAWKRFSFSGRLQFGEGVNFDPARPVLGRALDSRVTLTWKPTARWHAEFLLLKSSLREHNSGARLFNQEVLRNRTVYQFTRNNSVRAILEYDTRLRRAGVSFLYSFTPRPNTAFYFGYNDLLYNGLDPVTAARAPGLFRARRALYLKVSYGLRF